MKRESAQKSAIEVYENLRSSFPKVVPQSFETFMDGLEEAVRRAGEGLKLVGKSRDYFTGQRLEFLAKLLRYWKVGKEPYDQIMRDAAGTEWDGWMSRYFRYQEVPKDFVDGRDGVDPYKRNFIEIFPERE